MQPFSSDDLELVYTMLNHAINQHWISIPEELDGIIDFLVVTTKDVYSRIGLLLVQIERALLDRGVHMITFIRPWNTDVNCIQLGVDPEPSPWL